MTIEYDDKSKMRNEIIVSGGGNEVANPYDAKWGKETGVSRLKMGIWWHESVAFDKAFGMAMAKKMREVGCNMTLPNGQELSPEGISAGQEIQLFHNEILCHADLMHIIVSPQASKLEGKFHKGIKTLAELSDSKPEGWISVVPILLGDAQTPRSLQQFAPIVINAQDFANAGSGLFRAWEKAAQERGYKK